MPNTSSPKTGMGPAEFRLPVMHVLEYNERGYHCGFGEIVPVDKMDLDQLKEYLRALYVLSNQSKKALKSALAAAYERSWQLIDAGAK